MKKKIQVWLYCRPKSAAALLGALLWGLMWIPWSFQPIGLWWNGQRATGTVLALVEETVASVSTDEASPAAGQSVWWWARIVLGLQDDEQGTEAGEDEQGAEVGKEERGAEAGEEEAKAAPCVRVAPRVRYPVGDGETRDHTHHHFVCPTPFEVGQPAYVVFDPADPDAVLVSATASFLVHFIVVAVWGVGPLVVLCLVARRLWPPAEEQEKRRAQFEANRKKRQEEREAQLRFDPALGDDEALPRLAAGSSAAEVLATGALVASTRHIADGKYPLELCEMSAYMAALAYVEPEELKAYLAENCPKFLQVETFIRDNTEGFGFVYDGTAFIVMRGTTDWADWSRNLRALTTDGEEFLPSEPDWQSRPVPAGWEAPPRHRGFAEGWDVIRDQVEAWVATLPDSTPFIFSGHSLGGALSFLGAWEFAWRGRDVAAVITFGAALPGKAEFKKEFVELGLDKRTLRVEVSRDIVPKMQKYLLYEEVGRVWELERPPLLSQGRALAAVPALWLDYLLKAAIGLVFRDQDWWDKKSSESDEAAAAAKSRARARWTVLRLALLAFLTFWSVRALLAHTMQRRYAVPLSIMSYRRIRARHLAGLAEDAIPDFDACYEVLGSYLKALRGSTPENPGAFSSIANLPRKVGSATELEWLNTAHSARSW